MTSRDKWFIHKNAHEQLVTKEEFEKVAEIKRENEKMISAKKQSELENVLTDFMGK